MTSSESPYPTNPLDAIGSDGAFVIGDGFKFGQEYSESIIKALFTIPTADLGEALDLIRDQLLKLPLDVLKVFKDFIPDATENDFIDVVTSVTTIIDNLIAKPVWDTLLNTLQLICQFLTDNPLAQCIADLVEDTGSFAENFVRGAFLILEGLLAFLTDNPLINSFKDLVDDTGILLLNIVGGAAEALQRLMNLLGFANPGAALDFFENAVTELWELLSGAVAGGAKTLQEIFGVFTSWVDGIPALKPIIDAITGLTSITDLEGLSEWIRTNLLTITSRLPASNLFGQIRADLIGVLNVGHLTNEPVNLLRNPSFEDATTVSPVDGWSWDGTVNASGTGGSVKVVCDGYNKELSHQTAVSVAPADAMSLSAKVRTSGVTGSGWKAAITVMEYRNGAIATPVEIASRTSNTSAWVEISGSYIVPAGVSSVVFRLAVENATAGTVWFDDLDFHKSGSIAQEWVGNLTDTWESIYTGVTGSNGTGRRWQDMAPALGGVSSTANTAQTNAGTANTNLGFTWNSLWDAFNGTTGSTGKGFADTASKAGAVRSTANTADTNANTANGNLQSTWNQFFDAFNNTSGSTGRTLAQSATAAGTVRATASSANANANTAITNASTAQSTANSASTTANNASSTASTANTTANTANGRAVAINNRLFNANDAGPSSVVQIAALPTTDIASALRVTPAVGSGARVFRASETLSTTASPIASMTAVTGTRQFGWHGQSQTIVNFFDTSTGVGTKRTSDITFVTTAGVANTGAFVVSLDGWYQVEIGFAVDATASIAGGFAVAPACIINGNLDRPRIGADAWGSYGLGFGGRSRFAQSTFIVYLAANDYVQAGYNAAATYSHFFKGDANGRTSYFSISLLNRSTA